MDTYAAQLSNKSVSMYIGKQKVVKIFCGFQTADKRGKNQKNGYVHWKKTVQLIFLFDEMKNF